MSKIKIKWSEDDHSCDTCGYSYAKGATVWIDEKLILDEPAVARCWDSSDIENDMVFRRILESLGYVLEEEHETFE